MAKICDISGKKTQSGHHVSHAHNKVKRKFYPNLHRKKFFLAKHNAWLGLRVCTSVMRTINKKGVVPVLKKAYKAGTLAPSLRPIVAIL